MSCWSWLREFSMAIAKIALGYALPPDGELLE